MNIRSISPKLSLLNEKDKIDAQKNVQKDVSINTNYKEKEGKNSRDREDRGSKNEPLSDEEMEKAILRLKELSGFKKNRLNIRILKRGKKRLLCIEDSNGNLVRRVMEQDLWLLLDSQDKVKGQIFDKAV